MELLNGALGDVASVVVDECEPSWPPRVAIGWNHNLHGIADSTEVLSDVGFGRAVREISDE
jgi:hypothetical protein